MTSRHWPRRNRTWVSYQKARSLVSHTGWQKIQKGHIWPVGATPLPGGPNVWLAKHGSDYYLQERA
jgi:hypothetical protein